MVIMHERWKNGCGVVLKQLPFSVSGKLIVIFNPCIFNVMKTIKLNWRQSIVNKIFSHYNYSLTNLLTSIGLKQIYGFDCVC